MAKVYTEVKVKIDSKPKNIREDFKLVDGLNKCSNEEYHSDKKYYSSSAFKLLLKDPPQFKAIYIDESRESYLKDTGALSTGSLVHSLILEPDVTDSEFYVSEAKTRNANLFKADKLKYEAQGLTVVTSAQKILSDKMFEIYSQRKQATDLLLVGEPEVSLCIDLHGIPTKVRADWLNINEGEPRGIIIDVKTTGDDTDIVSFKRTCDRFGYMLSAALYTTAFEKFYGKPFDFYFIVLGKSSKTCDVFKISPETMAKGKAKVNEAFLEFKERSSKDSWNDYKVEEI